MFVYYRYLVLYPHSHFHPPCWILCGRYLHWFPNKFNFYHELTHYFAKYPDSDWLFHRLSLLILHSNRFQFRLFVSLTSVVNYFYYPIRFNQFLCLNSYLGHQFKYQTPLWHSNQKFEFPLLVHQSFEFKARQLSIFLQELVETIVQQQCLILFSVFQESLTR